LPFEVRDIRQNPDYINELINLGAQATPTFKIGDTVIVGFNPAKITEAWTAFNA
jgi:hypothetical protein